MTLTRMLLGSACYSGYQVTQSERLHELRLDTLAPA